ncbi:hypothetical protein Dgeo_1445 [Deinococcus geothermalis DSM 11300]|uniref:Uncharacterized protein n=1 Tax=Deinococcus geothermalis (strain DSM 11300 / CIP 105573 / AG-3a) TaxID=319795 RepID=Q1IYE4_DEIGD|nr:hypothetical protein Dgeo_1445 [Deinococcus geothermalis DSM 11300]
MAGIGVIGGPPVFAWVLVLLTCIAVPLARRCGLVVFAGARAGAFGKLATFSLGFGIGHAGPPSAFQPSLCPGQQEASLRRPQRACR